MDPPRPPESRQRLGCPWKLYLGVDKRQSTDLPHVEHVEYVEVGSPARA